MLNAIMLNVIMVNVILLNVIMVNVILLNVIMLNVECHYTECHYAECRYTESQGTPLSAVVNHETTIQNFQNFGLLHFDRKPFQSKDFNSQKRPTLFQQYSLSYTLETLMVNCNLILMFKNCFSLSLAKSKLKSLFVCKLFQPCLIF
jgi:hypothetical protein